MVAGGPVIALENVSKVYPHAALPAVANANLVVESGAVLALVGESGSGKTTTLKLINRLVEPTSGRITIDGADVRTIDPIALRRSIGYAFQGIGLFPHLTAAENIAIVPQLLRWSPENIRARVDELLDLVGLAPGEYRDRYPSMLSGGQRQRVGLARALAGRAKVLLMDEPFGALDPITRDELQIEFKRLQRALDLTVVIVTHDVTEALLLADTIAVMKEGRVLVQDTPSAMLAAPGHDYVRKLMAMPRRQAGRVAELDAAGR
jgi:osmoprotectant transport system ATP-binding protein